MNSLSQLKIITIFRDLHSRFFILNISLLWSNRFTYSISRIGVFVHVGASGRYFSVAVVLVGRCWRVDLLEGFEEAVSLLVLFEVDQVFFFYFAVVIFVTGLKSLSVHALLRWFWSSSFYLSISWLLYLLFFFTWTLHLSMYKSISKSCWWWLFNLIELLPGNSSNLLLFLKFSKLLLHFVHLSRQSVYFIW